MSKRKMNPVKKYAQGTDAKGMDPNHYIISPAEALNDYNIMLAKAEAEANSNPWLPIVAIAGQAMQTGIGIAGQASMAKAATGVNDPNSPNYKPKGTAAMGMNNVQKDVEVEGGEMFETPQGQVGEFKGPSHEQGGIPLELGQDVQEGTKVYSDRLKVGNKTLAERKATRERQVANLEKIASNNLADQAVKNAAKRKMMAIEKEEAADLDFQEKVNNMQKMADTMVEAFACGTGMKGIQKYPFGTPPFGIKKNPYADPANYDTNTIKNLHDALGIASTENGYGTAVGPKTLKAYQDFATKYMQGQGYPTAKPSDFSDISRFYKNGKVNLPNQGEAQALGLTVEGNKYIGPDSNFYSDMGKNVSADLGVPEVTPESMFQNYQEATKVDPFAMTAGEDWAKANPLPEGIEAPMPNSIEFTPKYATAETTADTTTKKEPSKFMKALEGNMPAVGDVTKLIGNYLSMTAGTNTAAEQRSTDVTHTNVFDKAGEESQKLLDNAKKGIEVNKAQGIVKASDVSRGGKKGARGSARGVNQMRTMDWLYDTALESQIADISAKAAEQISGIDVQKSGVAMSADQLKGQGEYQAAMANEAAKDAYYTALGLGRKDFATGMQQTGKDLNDMKENKIIEGLMKQYGTYFIGDKSGIAAKSFEEITGGKDAKGTKEEEVFLGPDGKTKFKRGKNNQLIQVT